MTGVVILLVAVVGVLAAVIAFQSHQLQHGQSDIGHKIDVIHKEVKTANGMSIGKLATNTEGRRILADVAHDDRTTSEQHYVDDISQSESETQP